MTTSRRASASGQRGSTNDLRRGFAGERDDGGWPSNFPGGLRQRAGCEACHGARSGICLARSHFDASLRHRKSRIRGTISSSLSSSAKWPVSRRWSSASGRSRRVGRCAVGGEDLVVLAPHDQGRRLPLAEERLEFRIERDVRSVVEEEVELDVLVARAVEQRLVVAPIVRIDP